MGKKGRASALGKLFSFQWVQNKKNEIFSSLFFFFIV